MMRNMFRRMRAVAEPVPPLALWAFWPYDQFPFLLSGKVVSQLEDGRVKVEGYSGMVFKPVYLASGAAGERLHREVRRVRAAYQIHEECARNGAGQVAHEHLLAAGLPEGALGKLRRTGWQGEAYQDLFRRQLREER